MSSLVLDASVAAKWFLPSAHEPLVTEALALLRSYTQGQLRFIVPDLFWAEFGNIMWKAARLGRCSRQESESAISVMRGHRVPASACSRASSVLPREMAGCLKEASRFGVALQITADPN